MMSFFNHTGKSLLSCDLTFGQKRMLEMREFQSRSRYGTVEPLSKPDFVKEVTAASESVWVFVHLFKD